MIIPVQIESTYIRYLPNEFYSESACSIKCHLDNVPDTNDLISSNIIAQCIELLSEDKYEIIVKDYHSKTGGKIILLNHGRIINDEIKQLLLSNVGHFFYF
jgi:glutathione synthase/RimK-type ligase-like ATP-grasp enzyme